MFQEPTGTGSNVHDKTNSRFPILEHLLVGSSVLCLPLQSVRVHVVYLHAYNGFFPWESCDLQGNIAIHPCSQGCIAIFSSKSHDFQGNMLNTTSAVPLKGWLPMVHVHTSWYVCEHACV